MHDQRSNLIKIFLCSSATSPAAVPLARTSQRPPQALQVLRARQAAVMHEPDPHYHPLSADLILRAHPPPCCFSLDVRYSQHAVRSRA